MQSQTKITYQFRMSEDEYLTLCAALLTADADPEEAAIIAAFTRYLPLEDTTQTDMPEAPEDAPANALSEAAPEQPRPAFRFLRKRVG